MLYGKAYGEPMRDYEAEQDWRDYCADSEIDWRDFEDAYGRKENS